MINGNAAALKKYRKFVNDRLDKPTTALREAISGLDPRNQLIDLYVEHLAGSSLQAPADLKNVRDALGIPAEEIPDASLEELGAFFAARNEIVHELDLVDPSGRGSSSRRTRPLEQVRDQCDEVFQHIRTFMHSTAKQVTAAKADTQP